jgi:hypothetical protein
VCVRERERCSEKQAKWRKLVHVCVPCVCAMCVVWAMCVGHVCGRTEGNVDVDVGVAGNIKSNST